MLNTIITLEELNEVFTKSNDCYGEHINSILGIEILTPENEILYAIGSCMYGINPDNTNILITCGLVDSSGHDAGATTIVCSTDMKTIILSCGTNSHIKL